MQNVGFNGNLILPLLCSTSSGTSNVSSPHDSLDTISTPTRNARSPLHTTRSKSVSVRSNTYNHSLDHISSGNYSSRTCPSTGVNSRNVSRKNSAVFHGIRVPSVDEDGLSYQGYPTSPAAFPHIRNLSTASASRPHSRQGSILEIGCLRKVDDIRGRADERASMQYQAKLTRQNLTALEIQSICQNIQEREMRALTKAALKETESRRNFWLKVLKISSVLMQVPSKLPMQVSEYKKMQAKKNIFKIFSLWKKKKYDERTQLWAQNISSLSLAAKWAIILMVSVILDTCYL
jgi:hypothetical protein